MQYRAARLWHYRFLLLYVNFNLGPPAALSDENLMAPGEPMAKGISMASGRSRNRQRRVSGNSRNRYWIYGRHASMAALGNPLRVCHRLLCASSHRRTRDIIGQAVGGQCPVEAVENRVIAGHLTDGAVHQGLALEVDPLPLPDIGDTLAPPPDSDKSTVVVLDQVGDPRNIGAILRSAAAFGARAVVTPLAHTPGESGAMARAASGGLDLLPWVRAPNLARLLAEMADFGYWRIGLDAAATTPLSETDRSGHVALIVGSEERGLRSLSRRHCDFLAAIPISGAMESLNVATAAAIALYEITERE